MRKLRQLGALLLLLVSYVAPVMACTLPEAQMSAQERACCRMMKNDCGDMNMGSNGHGCCQKMSHAADLNGLQTERVNFHPAVIVAVWAVTTFVVYPASKDYVRMQQPDDSPPESPPASISVLRI